jgi:hypothetical protein
VLKALAGKQGNSVIFDSRALKPLKTGATRVSKATCTRESFPCPGCGIIAAHSSSQFETAVNRLRLSLWWSPGFRHRLNPGPLPFGSGLARDSLNSAKAQHSSIADGSPAGLYRSTARYMLNTRHCKLYIEATTLFMTPTSYVERPILQQRCWSLKTCRTFCRTFCLVTAPTLKIPLLLRFSNSRSRAPILTPGFLL